MNTKFILAIGVLLIMAPLHAHAELIFTFTPAIQIGSIGAPLTFSGTLQNTGPSDVFVNGYSTSPLDPSLALDDTKFFNNVPQSLSSGASWSGEMFDINIAPNTPPADYVTAFTIIGGSDGDAQDDLATQSFTVRMPAAAVPEASPMSLLSVGLVAVGLLVFRRRYRCA